ncbi:hypothetical protein Stsp02_67220 [Streptomyces sp. NBRC 14336]|uniref:HEAT repeat domain-containing protein n=1 Tax=Streptomyces sp. NBRC 14336 TaxID=3030992 RepID=UPI0024A4CFF3|nr:HEAT repeat domain-containing protein [Streptomyces sp. NBRC 14336]GLW51061.1 hypothetical protein Stsp02_67220 [Streptomyces sp. NBRC 14336]
MDLDGTPDVGTLLEAVESADADVREEALDRLASAAWRDDDFAVATARAVPELARLARELPAARADLLRLLADLAERDDWPEEGQLPLVAVELPPLLSFAQDPDPAVRDSVTALVLSCRHLDALPLLRSRVAEEPEPGVRGHAVTALALLEPGDWRHALLTDPEPPVRLAAAEDLLRTAEPPFPHDLVDVCAQAYTADPYDLDEGHWAPAPHRRFSDRLLDDPEAALRAAAQGVPLAYEITARWRDREADVLPYALRDLEDGELHQLARLCQNLPEDLWAPVRERVRPFLDGGFTERAAAVTVLARVRAPEAVGEAVRLVTDEPGAAPGPYSVVLAVRAVTEVFGAGALPVARAVAGRIGRTHADLIRVLERYPEVALGVVDEITALVPRYEGGHAWAAVELLGALGPAAGEGAARALREEATGGDHSSVAVYAAMAHHRVTGDPALALRLLAADGPTRWSALAAGLGPAAAPLLPHFEPLLSPDVHPVTRARAAHAVLRITGRIEDTVEPLAHCAADAGAHHTDRLAAVTALTGTGPLPRSAVAPLRATAESPRRVVEEPGGGPEQHPDYVLREAVRTLLTAT